ncbi:ABC transporter permease [Desulfomonile tiedjei]|uniref:Transport permease protein n=1 Tax=Desulfomonile tiedjei (strain ATCC 49306 / DSM 6799 / DCB-1) TaxID=706587 RepID=I4CE41_DESTA|nr:ABC transporter permease [Desulfomonile tiedjei]AFM27832.1 ABC-type multidrug transport system, permease component [Desulfomonile tiedjei DSM 6799]
MSQFADGTARKRANTNGSKWPTRESVKASLQRISHLIRKEFIHIIRSKQNFRMLLIAPLVQLVVFGYASRLDVKDVDTVIADLDHSTMSRQITDAFSRSGYFRIVAHVNSYDAVDDYMLRGKAAVAILIPPDLERQIQGFRTVLVGVLIDGVDTTTAGTVSGYAQSILQQFSTDLIVARMNQMQGLLYTTANPRIISPGVTDAGRAWFNPNLNSKNFFVPGVVVLIILAMSIVLTSAIIVREKEIGTIEQLMVTPISRFELILGKTIPSFILEFTTLTVITPLAFLMFDIPFKGSVWFFYVTSIIFLITTSGIGITISAFCKTQQQAVLTSFMFLQPSVLLSGYAFPIENMPVIIQYVTYLNPLRYFITIMRGVFLKGTGWEILWPQVIPMIVMAIFYVALASFLFKKRVD